MERPVGFLIRRGFPSLTGERIVIHFPCRYAFMTKQFEL